MYRKDGKVMRPFRVCNSVATMHGNVSEGNLRTGRNVEIKFNIAVGIRTDAI